MKEAIWLSATELVSAGEREPLGHQLFHEAWSQRRDLPRSSLLIGVTAAEVGFKSLIGELVPHAEWLALHAPTPPLIEMLTDYLPKLPVKIRINNAAPFIPKTILDSLKKGIKLRNETAHAGKGVKPDSLDEILRAVRDLLYLLDLYGGHSWALREISHATRELINGAIDGSNQGKAVT
jgi:hypothetical protein